MLENGPLHNLTSKLFAKRLTIQFISSSIGKNILFYICISEKMTYDKPKAMPI